MWRLLFWRKNIKSFYNFWIAIHLFYSKIHFNRENRPNQRLSLHRHTPFKTIHREAHEVSPLFFAL